MKLAGNVSQLKGACHGIPRAFDYGGPALRWIKLKWNY